MRKIEKEAKTTMINGKTVKEIESELSKYNHKTCNTDEFIQYLKAKIRISNQVHDFYSEHHSKLHRRLRYYAWWLRRYSENKMLNRFKELFGGPKEVVVVFGDWGKGSYNMRGKEPTKGKGMREVFRKYGYDVYLVNEFNTSCKCSKCRSNDGKTETFLKKR
jgi:hypothetical protein